MNLFVAILTIVACAEARAEYSCTTSYPNPNCTIPSSPPVITRPPRVSAPILVPVPPVTSYPPVPPPTIVSPPIAVGPTRFPVLNDWLAQIRKPPAYRPTP